MKNKWLLSGLIITIIGLILFLLQMWGIYDDLGFDWQIGITLSLIGFIMLFAGIVSIIVGFIFKKVEKNTDMVKAKGTKYKLILVVAIILLIFGYMMYTAGQRQSEQQDSYLGPGIIGDASASRQMGRDQMTIGSILLFFGSISLIYVVVSMIPKKSNLFSKRNCPKCGRKIPF